jgi:hypothetical protein
MATMTFYPDAHPESTTVDGFVRTAQYSETWDTIHNAASGDDVQDANALNPCIMIISGPIPGRWQGILRGIFLFNTSTLPAGITITQAVLKLYGWVAVDNLHITPDVNIYSCTPSSNIVLALSDYPNFGTTPLSTPISNWNASGDNEFIINDLSVINKSGITKLATRNACYDVADVEPTWDGALKSSYFGCYFADTTEDNHYKPRLIITYSLGRSWGYILG